MKISNFKFLISNLWSRRAAGGILMVTLFTSANFALARTPKVQVNYGAVTIAALGVEEPAILASNPFYGLTDLMRGMKDSFASGYLEKALLKKANLNLKAAQLLKIRMVAPENTKSIVKALNEYQLAVYQYGIMTSRLSAADFSSTGGAGTASGFIDSSLINLRFIDDVLANSQTSFDQAILNEIFDRLAQASLKIFVDDIGLTTAKLHIMDTLPGDSLVAIRNAEMISALAKEATVNDNFAAAQELMALRVAMLDDIAGRLVGSNLDTASAKTMSATLSIMPVAATTPISHLLPNQVADLNILAGLPAERIQTLSYLLSTPEFSQDTDLIALRNQLLIKVFSR